MHGRLWGVSHTGSYGDYESDGSNGNNEKCGYKFFIVDESKTLATAGIARNSKRKETYYIIREFYPKRNCLDKHF